MKDAVHDAPVDERSASVELARLIQQSETSRRATPTRRAIYLAVGKDRHVPLTEVTRRIVVLVEDHSVDVTQLRLDGVHDLVLLFDRELDFATNLDQRRQVRRLHAQANIGCKNGSVEGSPVRDVERDITRTGRHDDTFGMDEGRDVGEAHGANPAVLDAGNRLEPSGRYIHDDGGFVPGDPDDAALDC